MDDLADAIMKLINSSPRSPRKEELTALLGNEKWKSILVPHLKKHPTEDAPKNGRPIIVVCKDGMAYAAYYGLAVDDVGEPIVEAGDADIDFPWVVLDPSGETAAISNDEIKFWMEYPIYRSTT